MRIETLEAIKTKRSIRHYKDKTVSDEYFEEWGGIILVKSVYLLENSKNLNLEEIEGYYDEKKMINVVLKNGKKIPIISSDKILITETKTFEAPGDDEEEEEF